MASKLSIGILNVVILFFLLISDMYFLVTSAIDLTSKESKLSDEQRMLLSRAVIVFGALALNTTLGIFFTFWNSVSYLLVFAILQLVIPFVGLVNMVGGYIGASLCTAIIAFVHIYLIEEEEKKVQTGKQTEDV